MKCGLIDSRFLLQYPSPLFRSERVTIKTIQDRLMSNMDQWAVMLREGVNYHPVPRGSICYFWAPSGLGKRSLKGSQESCECSLLLLYHWDDRLRVLAGILL